MSQPMNRMQQCACVVFALAFINGAIFAGVSDFNGGFPAAGKVENGRFYLGKRGRQYTEVDERTYTNLKYWEATIIPGILMAFLSMALTLSWAEWKKGVKNK